MSDIQEKMMALQRRRIASGAGSKSKAKKRSSSKSKAKPKKSNSKAMGRAQNNGWLKFFAKYRKEHRGKYPATEMMVKAGASWRRLSEKEKCKYSKKDMKITGGSVSKSASKSKACRKARKGSKSKSGGSKTKKRIARGGCGQCPHCGK